MISRPLFLSLSLAVASLASVANAASVLVSGGAIVDFDQPAWATLAGGLNSPGFEALTLDEFFDQAAADARTSAQILSDEVQANPAYTGLLFALNGGTVTNLTGRTAQPTTFEYDYTNLTAHTGVIGFGGVTRWDVNPLLGGGNLVFGDLTLEYDADRLLVGGSGWALTTNILPAGVAFDLINVTTNATETSLAISGDLAVSYEVANLLLLTPGDHLKDVGNFSFTAAAVPEPASAILLLLGAASFATRRRR